MGIHRHIGSGIRYMYPCILLCCWGLVCQLSCQGTYLQTSYRWRICHKHVQQYGDSLMGTADIHVDILLLTGGVILGGIKNGIEKFSKIMMPVLFFMMIMIAIRSVTLPGASEGISFLFKPDFSKITGDTLIKALGQAFFSLSIGCGTILTYSSYVKK